MKLPDFLERRLPHRILYAGEFVGIQLVGLARDRSLAGYRPPGLMLLVVACGRAQLRLGEERWMLGEADVLVLDPRRQYDLTTGEYADLLFITLPAGAERAEMISTFGEECYCPKMSLSLA